MFTIYSNFREVGQADSLADAKQQAVRESLQFDDVHTIAVDGRLAYMAQHGRLYRLTGTR